MVIADMEVTPFVKSNFVQVVKHKNKIVLWHSLFGYPRIVSPQTLDFIDSFVSPQTLKSLYDEYYITDEEKIIINEFVENYYLIPEDFDERVLLKEKMGIHEKAIISGSLIDYLELIMSESCNFRCTYCIHFNNLETSDRLNNKKLMRFEIAKNSIDSYLAILRKHKKHTAEINFGGGEPLLAWSIIQQVLVYCTSVYESEFEFRFSINTNTSLITRDIARQLKQYNVEIASSLDGFKEENDTVRITNSGEGTFDSIIDGFNMLSQENHALDGFAITVNENNFKSLDERIIDFAFKRGMKNVRIDIDVIDMVEIPVNDIVEKLMRIRKYAKNYGISVPGFWSRAFENLNGSALEEHMAFCGAVRGNSMCVSPSGKIYGCGYSTTELGTLAEIESFHAPENQYHRFVRDHLTGTMEMCKGCMIESQCGGGCNITQEFARAKHTTKLDRMCDFYRQMTRELIMEQLENI